ncbi:hypothetical protein J1605_001687 [Eschrichtius robustus]|uniref:Uncharacterized protein n=1 Tax=Eschrichtius robustus TaxID=9764 RepID=A0AB34HYS9_ESCRO|nr:hypothetical protein J1605_001687 [Eschrichtius robustus]
MALGASQQEADAAYKVKVELQAKEDSLDKDIKFLKCLYDARCSVRRDSLSLGPLGTPALPCPPRADDTVWQCADPEERKEERKEREEERRRQADS